MRGTEATVEGSGGRVKVDLYPLIVLAISFGLCLLFGNLEVYLFPLGFLLSYCEMLIHEIGHALFYALAGNIAIPFFFFSISTGYCLPFHLMVIAVLGAMTVFCCYRHEFFFGGISGFAGLLAFYLLFCSDQVQDMVGIIGGLVNELTGSVILMLLFYYPLHYPRKWRQLRYTIVAIAAMVFSNSTVQWIRSLADHRYIPYPHDSEGGLNVAAVLSLDSVINGAPTGDLDRLIQLHGWEPAGLIYLHLAIALTSLSVLLGKVITEVYAFKGNR
jgi:hypothetical protein